MTPGRPGDKLSNKARQLRIPVVKARDILQSDREDEAAGSDGYAREVGLQLRLVRQRLRLSLQAVESMSEQEFKASVLGAYERGERAISVPRLQRLAKLYDVPVDNLLPEDHPIAEATGANANVEGTGTDRHGEARMILDLSKLDRVKEPERELLRRFVRMIQLQRQDTSSTRITIRAEDLRSIDYLLGENQRLDDQWLKNIGFLIEP
jgi:transcriptional regulator with XRE-family HTH domain